jgi:hypothetical protein
MNGGAPRIFWRMTLAGLPAAKAGGHLQRPTWRGRLTRCKFVSFSSVELLLVRCTERVRNCYSRCSLFKSDLKTTVGKQKRLQISERHRVGHGSDQGEAVKRAAVCCFQWQGSDHGAGNGLSSFRANPFGSQLRA